MQGKYILIAFTVLFLFAAPAAASLNKITANAPVYIGEGNLDISSALNGCHAIAWWPNGTSTSTIPKKNLSIYEINTVSEKIYDFTISPDIFGGYEGVWYCEEKLPHKPVFEVRDPRISLKVWDVDRNQDISGMSVPLTANITYRIETNMDQALRSKNRPDMNPSDSFFSVILKNPSGQGITSIYTGSAGSKNTQILSFDSKPFVDSSPYFWKNGHAWDVTSKNAFGEIIYPPGTYTFALTQNLNHMREVYNDRSAQDLEGKITSSASVTFITPSPTPPSGVTPTIVTATPVTSGTGTPAVTPVLTGVSPTSPVAKKTTYSPLPAWTALLGTGIAGIFVLIRRFS